jgi:hypothetical protein
MQRTILFHQAIIKQTLFLLDKQHREGVTQMNQSTSGISSSIKLNGINYDSAALGLLEQIGLYIRSTQIFKQVILWRLSNFQKIVNTLQKK